LKLPLSNLIIVYEATNSTQFRKEAATRAQSQSLAREKSQAQQSAASESKPNTFPRKNYSSSKAALICRGLTSM
jgi:hypothetical protein